MITRIIHIILIMVVLCCDLPAQPPVLYFVDSNSVHLRWNGTRKTSVDGYKVYRKKASDAEWMLMTTTPLRPVYAYNDLNRILGFKTAAYLQLLGENPNARKDLNRNSFSRVYQDEKSAQMFGVMTLMNPEYALALGERFEDRNIQRNESYEYRITYVENNSEKELAKTTVINAGRIMAVPVPTELTATPLNAAITLDWKREPELIRNATIVSHAIYRSEDLLGPYQKENFYGLLSVTVNNTRSSTERYKISFLENGKTYYLTVKAVNAFGIESAAAPVVEATPMAATLPYVTGLSVVGSSKSAKLSWTESASVEIFRSAGTESFKKVFPPADATMKPVRMWYDHSVVEGNEYRYFVKVVGSTVTSDTVKWTMPDVTPPAPPRNIKATSRKGIISLQWDPNREPDILGYEIERASDVGMKTRFLLTSKPMPRTIFNDSLRYQSQTLFGYIVYAVDKSYNRSLPSELVAVKMPDLQPPAAPNITSLKRVDEGASLEWQSAGERDIAKYIIYAARGAKDRSTKVSEVNTRSYLHAVDSGTYFYTVSAVDSAGNESPRSGSREIRMPSPLFRAAPVSGTIVMKGGDVVLRWKPAPGSKPAGYIITRKEPNGKQLDIAQLKPNTSEFTDNYPAKGRLTYEIRARNDKWQMGKPLILQIDYK